MEIDRLLTVLTLFLSLYLFLELEKLTGILNLYHLMLAKNKLTCIIK